MAKFIIKSFNPAEGCYFILLDDQGRLLFTSGFYKTKRGCLNGIKLVKEAVKSETGIDDYFLNNIPSRVLLRAENGKYLGSSECYDTVDESISILQEIIKASKSAYIVK